MPRAVNSDVFKPILRFRYKASMVGQAPGLEFYGRSVDLPKWNNVDGWVNPLKIRCYHFEGITVRELSEIRTKDVELKISIVAPDTTTIIYEWRLIGDVIDIDYGNMDRGFDEVTEAVVTFLPKSCEIAFEPNKQEK